MTTVAAAVATFVESLVDLAVMVMTPPAGTVEVLLNVAVAPLAVWLVILPQLEVPQLRLQSTPRAAESWRQQQQDEQRDSLQTSAHTHSLAPHSPQRVVAGAEAAEGR